jgi:hypothetical protein
MSYYARQGGADMKSLSNIWQRAQHAMAASTWFETPDPMKNEMRRLGWSFRDHVMGLPPGVVAVRTEIRTPQGRVLNGEHPEDFARYAALRRELADKLYPVPA